MGKFGISSFAVLLVFINGPFDIVSSLSCYTCTSLAVSNSFLNALGRSRNKACEIFDSSGVSLEECQEAQESSNGNEVVACEKWEGSFTVDTPRLGSTEMTGQSRGCALVSTEEMHKCTPSTDVTAFYSDIKNLYQQALINVGDDVVSIGVGDVQGMHCVCDRNNCNGADGLRIARPWLFIAVVLLFQALLQFHFLC